MTLELGEPDPNTDAIGASFSCDGESCASLAFVNDYTGVPKGWTEHGEKHYCMKCRMATASGQPVNVTVGLSWEQAIQHLMSGARVRRRGWKKTAVGIEFNPRSKFVCLHGRFPMFDGGVKETVGKWSPYQDDFMSSDWEIVQ